ncbi:FAD/NAD(P)-binding protein [Streptomyces indicus]|uniref:FAD-NAD(P)-binding n=1 Tax=Streptomyces indicus TaxID=417292 RepID=A0A1G8UCJ8_9ACTN|nr:FAD/NAD(P)-binding protein [Streptomyces indicus]SDJ51481.1 FAD-NAD(P)-binding [Streptomyces indicus]
MTGHLPAPQLTGHRPAPHQTGHRPAVLAIVGAGPRTTGLLERLAANAPELWPDDRPLEIHLIDPHPPGPGRIWRHDQSPLLRMNSMAEDVTMFTDESSTVDGPVRPGPSLAEWAAQFSGAGPRHLPYTEPGDPEVLAELRTLAPTDFPTRRAQSAYLDWVFRRVLTELPPTITVTWHRTTATAVSGEVDGVQEIHFTSHRTSLRADLVILAQGHLDSSPDPRHAANAAFARRHGRFHLPPAFTADADLSSLRPGEHVLVRGFGLAFIDLMALLTEGRGGTFTPSNSADGALTYHPSGQEPILHIGSRRGVPYHAKTRYRLQGPRPPLPRYFGPEALDTLLAKSTHGPLDFHRDVWPLMAKEIAYGHYHELFHAHPNRVTLPWPAFSSTYDQLPWHSPHMKTLIASSIPNPTDRLDFATLDRPLAGVRLPSPSALQNHLRTLIAEDVNRRENPHHSADLGAFHALLSIYGQLPRLVDAGRLSARSVTEDLDGWWRGFFSFLASGPPGFRLRQLLALSEAGIVHFLGADVTIATDESTGTFTATSPTVPGHTTHATALIESYLPTPSLTRTRDPLLHSLHTANALTEETLTDPTTPHPHPTGLLKVTPTTAHVVDPSLSNGPHPRRIALGAPTNSRGIAAFARPRTDAPAFRQNDGVARGVLRILRGTSTAGERQIPAVSGETAGI